jgi:hypothetical protein
MAHVFFQVFVFIADKYKSLDIYRWSTQLHVEHIHAKEIGIKM